MHKNDMNLSKLMASIEEYKLSRISRNLKMGGSNEQNQPRFKKRTPNHDGPSAPKVKGKCGGSYKGVKRTYSTCGMKHFWKCLVGTKKLLRLW